MLGLGCVITGDVIIDAGDVIIDAGDVIIDAGDVIIDAGDVIIDAGDVIIDAGEPIGGDFVLGERAGEPGSIWSGDRQAGLTEKKG